MLEILVIVLTWLLIATLVTHILFCVVVNIWIKVQTHKLKKKVSETSVDEIEEHLYEYIRRTFDRRL